MSTFPWTLFLLLAAVVAIVWIVRGRRPAPPPPQSTYQQPPMADQWGRPVPPQAQQPGIGGSMMGGLATGLAVGAGALAAQEIGRRMMGEHGQQGVGGFDDQHHRAGGSAADSQLARDAGLGSVGLQDTASWDGGGYDAGGFDGGFDGGDSGGGGGDSGD
jgi:uncharacterized membrane protein YgcG